MSDGNKQQEPETAFESSNFRVNSDGWETIIVRDQKYLINPQADIHQIIGGGADGEQLFTWEAAIRETAEAGEQMPTYDDFEKSLKIKNDIPNIIYAGVRNLNGIFINQGEFAYFWSTTKNFKGAFTRHLYIGNDNVMKKSFCRNYGFSVRCLKKK